jgi:serine/threonine-protein kinase
MQLPEQFGKYELEKFLGGGMSHVFRARDTVLNRTVCVKILTPEGASDKETRARFLAEAKMSAGLVHDNIIRIFDYGEQDGKPYIVMEFLTGGDLRSAISEGKTGDVASQLRILLQGARALQYVHQQQLIHRDIKPDNLHVDSSGRVRLMDFGIAKSQDLHLTKTGYQVGTPYYMSPEQIMGEPATDRVDIYAYGIMMFELFTGTRPVMGETIERLFYQILNEPLKLELLREKGVPESIVLLVGRMTAKDPKQRPGSFAEVIPELELALSPPRPVVPADAEGVSGRKVTMVMLVIALVITVGFIAAVMLNLDTIRKSFTKRKALIPPEDMVLVEAGKFLAGADRHAEELPLFFIDKTEVSNGSFQKFCDAKKRPLPAGFDKAHPEMPVTSVTIVEAKDYCAWQDRRLPTPLEWEKAARGKDGRRWPWGNEPDSTKATTDDKPITAVTANPQSMSPFGALNMAGNVWEWVDGPLTPSPGAVEAFAKVLNPPATATEPWYSAKGGAADRPVSEAVAFEFIPLPARFTAPNIGFRCAKTPQP